MRSIAKPAPPDELLATYFWPHVDQSGGEDACWPWTRSLGDKGYGQINNAALDGRWIAHVLAYASVHGSAPVGMEIDHTCHNMDVSCAGGPSCPHRACCNPTHLEAVTPGENSTRADALRGRGQFKTHCAKDHPYDEENTGWLVRKSGPRAGERQRYCLQCNRDNAARQKAKTVRGAPRAMKG